MSESPEKRRGIGFPVAIGVVVMLLAAYVGFFTLSRKTEKHAVTETPSSTNQLPKSGDIAAQARQEQSPTTFLNLRDSEIRMVQDERRVHIVCKGFPPIVHGLSSEPEGIEPELKRGRWLVLVFPTYNPVGRSPFLSARDYWCISRAIKAGLALKDGVQIGLRGYDDENEHNSWCPECAVTDTIETPETPIWVIIEDGAITSVRRGEMDTEEIVKWWEDRRIKIRNGQ